MKKTPCKKTENRNHIHPLLALSLAHSSHTLAISASMTNLNITVQYHNITIFIGHSSIWEIFMDTLSSCLFFAWSQSTWPLLIFTHSDHEPNPPTAACPICCFTLPHFHIFTFHLVNFHSHHVNSSTQACISSYLRVNATCPICRKPLNEITCTPRFSFPFLQILTGLSFSATWC